MSSESIRRDDDLARTILTFSRRRISAAAPLLLPPIYALRQRPRREPGPMSTDGVHLDYCPRQVIEDFRADRDGPARQLLHTTLHCLLGHLAQRPGAARLPLFDALADQKAAALARALAGDPLVPPAALRGIALSTPPALALPAWYRSLSDSKEDARRVLGRADHFAVDDHSAWAPPAAAAGDGGAGGGDADRTDAAPDWASMLDELGRQAKDSPLWGHAALLLERELSPCGENGISYGTFLRRFAQPRERLLMDPDSFDPRWYHLGLELYGDVPLLDPSELSEPPAPDELVIALDTSGSCDGAICRRFLRETLNLLRDITDGAAAFRLYLVQCDTEIQRELLLESRDQLEHVLEDFTPRGFGGTDFRPVFRRVEELRGSGELPRVRGLLYLSDTYGDFPDAAPDYPVAFLVPRQEHLFCAGDGGNVPGWVTTVSLDPNDFTIKEATQ